MKVSFYEKCVMINRKDLLKLWDRKKNKLSPHEVSKGSNLNIWWRCDNNHSWQMIVNKIIRFKKCPYCNHKRISKDYNLKKLHPKLSRKWDYEKNYPIKPKEVFPSSNLSYWWKCKNGHSFKQKLIDTSIMIK